LHVPADPLLATDIESLAHTVGDYFKRSLGATTVAVDLAHAIEAAMINGGRVATLIVPQDVQIGEAWVPSYLTTEQQTVILAEPEEDSLGALAALASEASAPEVIDQALGEPSAMPKGRLDARAVSAVIARLQPVDCIVMDEVLAVGVPYFNASKHSQALGPWPMAPPVSIR
jgi:hypothetical protein